jgi:hypothetical protein
MYFGSLVMHERVYKQPEHDPLRDLEKYITLEVRFERVAAG